ncbi:MAG: GNAT family N-acetyltransferase [Paracoccaceae bacterium]
MVASTVQQIAQQNDQFRQGDPNVPGIMAQVLELLRASFAYMDGRINPPSSIHRLTVGSMQAHRRSGGEIWTVGKPVVACMFLTPKPERLYLGKLAVAPEARGRGLGRLLVTHAEGRAREMGFSVLELETRIELTENHVLFSRLGFVVTGTERHQGFDHATDVVMRKPLSSSVDS